MTPPPPNLAEREGNEAAFGGCGRDSRLVWTSDRCKRSGKAGRYVQVGRDGKGASRFCRNEDAAEADWAYVRCCGNVAPEVGGQSGAGSLDVSVELTPLN